MQGKVQDAGLRIINGDIKSAPNVEMKSNTKFKRRREKRLYFRLMNTNDWNTILFLAEFFNLAAPTKNQVIRKINFFVKISYRWPNRNGKELLNHLCC